MLAPGTVLQNRYEIRQPLGAGGMGAVYLAFDLRLKSLVAVKENSHTDPRQFEQEAQLLFKLVHPNLPRVIDHFIEPSGLQYLVMDYIEGQDLESRIARTGVPSEAQVREWFLQIFDAVSYLHGNHIIHRDIKPPNIRITPTGRAVLVDFGIAKIVQPGVLTATGAKFGSAGYAAPEQYYGGTDERTDVYCLGATLYAILTGTAPPDASALERGSALLVSPRQLNPTISPQMEQLILKALQIKPNGRFQSVAEMKQNLQMRAGVGTTAIGAVPFQPANATAVLPPVTVPERTRGRMNPVFWVVLAGLGLLGVGVAAWALFSSLTAPLSNNAPTPLAAAVSTSVLLTATNAPTQTFTDLPTNTATRLPTPNQTETAAFDATRVAGLFQATVSAQESATALIFAYNATQTALAPTMTPTPIPPTRVPTTAIPPTRIPATRVPPTAVPSPVPTEPPTATPPRTFFAIHLNSPAPGQAFGNPQEAPFLQWTPATGGELAPNEFYRIQTSHGGAPICNIYTKQTFYSLPPTGVAGEGCNPAQWQFNTGDWIWRISFVQRIDSDVSHDIEVTNSEGRLFKWNCDGKFC